MNEPRKTLQIGDRVSIIDSEKITSDLWHKSGVIEEVMDHPELAYSRASATTFLLVLDDQSFRMKAVWVQPHMVY